MAFERTITLLSGGKLKYIPRREVVLAIVAVFKPFKVISVQFGYDNILVVFEKSDGKVSALGWGGINICGKYVKIEGGAQVLTVVVFDYPYEASEAPVRAALKPFGTYKSSSFQKFPFDDMVMYTGARLVRFVLGPDTLELPRSIMIGGYFCRIWHRGQSIQCNICSKEGHKATSCPLKGKCLHCHKEGHFSRNCPDKADPPAADVNVIGSDPLSGEGVPGSQGASAPGVAVNVPSVPPPAEVSVVTEPQVTSAPGGVAHVSAVPDPPGVSAPGGAVPSVSNVSQVSQVENAGSPDLFSPDGGTLGNVSQVSQVDSVGSPDPSSQNSGTLGSCSQVSQDVDSSMDTRDNELDELASQASVTTVLKVTLSPRKVASPPGESVSASVSAVSGDSAMHELNLRKRSLSCGSSEGDEKEGSQDVSPPSRRPKIRPPVNVSGARSRSRSCPREDFPGDSLC